MGFRADSRADVSPCSRIMSSSFVGAFVEDAVSFDDDAICPVKGSMTTRVAEGADPSKARPGFEVFVGRVEDVTST